MAVNGRGPRLSAGDEHGHGGVSMRRLFAAFLINFVFLVVEVIGGLVTNSLALLADAGHMLTDVAALALALFVSYLASRPATPRRTFGLLRAEVIGAFVNGASLVLVVGLIFREAVHRFGEPPEIDAPLMLAVAVLGLAANLVSAAILHKGHEDNVNQEGAFLHMVGDALGSVGAIVAGVAIWLRPGLAWVDPLASVVIGVIIMYGAAGLVRRTLSILLESVPEDIDYLEVKDALENQEHIALVHDLHIWTITSGMTMLSAHVALARCSHDKEHWSEAIEEASAMLEDRFGINHTTIQANPAGTASQEQCSRCKAPGAEKDGGTRALDEAEV